MKAVIGSILGACLTAMIFFGVSIAKDSFIHWADNRYVVAAESLFVYAQRLRREIHNEKQKPNPDQAEIEFLELQLQETEAEMKKKGG